jgi:hypothetical protein
VFMVAAIRPLLQLVNGVSGSEAFRNVKT